jgi:hypothetical protein
MQLDMGDLSLSGRTSIKSCLETVLEIVSIDLAEAAKLEVTCKTFQVLIQIFDEAIDYQANEYNELVARFKYHDGFHRLQQYLVVLSGTALFPGLDEISTVLTVLRKAVSVMKSFFWGGIEEKRRYREQHADFFGDVIVISRCIMYQLLSFDDDTLVRLDDDSIDICKQVEQIFSSVRLYYPRSMFMSGYYDLFRMFLYRLVSISSGPLKLIGLIELQAMAQTHLPDRPAPRAYFVQGAGTDLVNGIYMLKTDEIIGVDGFLGLIFETCYVKVSGDCDDYHNKTTAEESKDVVLSYCDEDGRWFIYKQGGDRKDIDFYATKIEEYYDNVIVPCSGWMKIDGIDPLPTVTPIGLAMPAGMEYSTQEHDFVDWMLKMDVFGLVVNDAQNDCYGADVRSEAQKAKNALVKSIERVLDLVLQTIPDQSVLALVAGEDVSLNENGAIQFVELIMKHLLLLSDGAFQGIGKDSIRVVCDRLEQINRRIGEPNSTSYRQRMIDYDFFYSLVSFRANENFSDFDSIDYELSEKELKSHPVCSIIVEGAGSAFVNGRYELTAKSLDQRFMKYINFDCYDVDEDHDDDFDDYHNGLIIHRCEYGGPETGRWVISDNGPYWQTDYYVSHYGGEEPPLTSWIEFESGLFPPPTLTHVLREISTVEADSFSEYSSSDMTEYQNRLWVVLRHLSAISDIGRPKNTASIIEGVLLGLESLDEAESKDLHGAFSKCSHLILSQIVEKHPALDFKKQLLITQFLGDEKRDASTMNFPCNNGLKTD